MAEIRPEEISAILREQLAGSKTQAELEEVNTDAYRGRWCCPYLWFGPKHSRVSLLQFQNGIRLLCWNGKEDNVGAVLFGDSKENPAKAIP